MTHPYPAPVLLPDLLLLRLPFVDFRGAFFVSACIDSRGHQMVMGFNTGRVACARYVTGRVVGHLDFHQGEVTDVVGVWNEDSG